MNHTSEMYEVYIIGVWTTFMAFGNVNRDGTPQKSSGSHIFLLIFLHRFKKTSTFVHGYLPFMKT